ncbi:1589_t:CDS:2 [Diversispora eburnea]|uniref:1589_t:CDS:1 n=1 Tax=Diversispora eburnea TaxID=1213867 RepID=A0A9N8V576_9GLOM|nr:1589_t:CDS:2 [Diversispora eburnea]
MTMKLISTMNYNEQKHSPSTTATTDNTQAFTPNNTTTTQIPLTESTNIPKDAVGHIVDVAKAPFHNQEDTENYVIIPNTSYFVYMTRAVRNLFMTFVFDWSLAILHPLTFLTYIIIVPILLFSLLAVEIFLRIGFYLGLENYVNYMSAKWGKGLSTVNWLKDGIIGLDKPPPEPLKEEALDDDVTIQTRNFDLDMAELLLFISSIVYERNEKLVRQANEAITALTDDKKDVNLTAQDFESIYEQFYESEVRIREQASLWGMKFTSLSELNSLGGPFSGMFYSEEHSFIVAVFKGTTPTNFEDFIVDLMLQRVDARSFVFGEVHEGFYSSLFPQAEKSSARANSASPYLTIIRAIRAKAADILNYQATKNKNGVPKRKINVWVTGHSLGAALASLFFARCLKSPEDLGPNCILRDGYVFGSPALGDNDFAAEFASHSNSPFNQQSILWRVIDDTDIITRMHGFEDSSIRRVINKRSLLNFVHVGEGIRFFQDGKRPESSKKIFSSGKEPVIIERFDIEEGEEEKILNKEIEMMRSVASKIDHAKNIFLDKPFEHMEGSPLIYIEKLLPVFFRNHLPARYFEAMQKARKYFDGQNEIRIKENKDPVVVDTDDSNSSNF